MKAVCNHSQIRDDHKHTTFTYRIVSKLSYKPILIQIMDKFDLNKQKPLLFNYCFPFCTIEWRTNTEAVNEKLKRSFL